MTADNSWTKVSYGEETFHFSKAAYMPYFSILCRSSSSLFIFFFPKVTLEEAITFQPHWFSFFMGIAEIS